MATPLPIAPCTHDSCGRPTAWASHLASSPSFGSWVDAPMSWKDTLYDPALSASFVSSSLSLSPPVSYSPSLPRLEQDFFKDFTCCGVPLNDMHDLVAHFEESHVDVLSSDSPSESSISTPSTPEEPATPPSEPEPIFIHNHPFFNEKQQPAYSTSVFAITPAAAFTATPFDTTPTFPPVDNKIESDDDDLMMDIETVPTSPESSKPATPPPPSCVQPTLTYKAPHKKGAEKGRPPKKIKRDDDSPATPVNPIKAYKCPHLGCTKAYRNPNGLKYHLSKGTCDRE